MKPLPTDIYRDAFLSFMEQGMTYCEALEQFDEKDFAKVAMEEIFSDEAVIDRGSLEFVTNDNRKLPALFSLLTRAQFERRNSVDGRDYQQALDLWQAGWTSEAPRSNTNGGFWSQVQVMSWYWRAPSKRPGKPGRRYLSTNQAWNALQKLDIPKP